MQSLHQENTVNSEVGLQNCQNCMLQLEITNFSLVGQVSCFDNSAMIIWAHLERQVRQSLASEQLQRLQHTHADPCEGWPLLVEANRACQSSHAASTALHLRQGCRLGLVQAMVLTMCTMAEQHLSDSWALLRSLLHHRVRYKCMSKHSWVNAAMSLLLWLCTTCNLADPACNAQVVKDAHDMHHDWLAETSALKNSHSQFSQQAFQSGQYDTRAAGSTCLPCMVA